MKRAKIRRRLEARKPARSQRKRYRLVDLMAEMPEGKFELPDDLRAWDEMKPVGREFR